MIEIKTGGESLDLPSGFSIEIEESSPIFNDRGSQSIPATVPATRRNCRLLAAPHRIDTANAPNNPERIAEVVAGAYIRRGTLNITEAGKREGITFNIGFDNSTAYAKWQKKKLAELSGLPIYSPPTDVQGYPIELTLDYLYNIYRFANPQTDDFAVFPVAINNEATGSDEAKIIYWEVLNCVGDHGLAQPSKVNRLIDGVLTEVSVPEGYCVSPFLRVWRVVELIFADLGIIVANNPFKNNLELARLVVLNNTADSVCRAEIKYSDLLPDCTVQEFLNALYVRFGLVYNIDNNTGTAILNLIKDIITQRGGSQIEDFATGPEKIVYEVPQYVKLSAQTSIEGAAPSHERFEDFAKGLDISKVRMGAHVSIWQNTGTQDDPKWDGDVRDDYEDNYDPDYDYPEQEPDYPEPDYPEEYAVRSAVQAAESYTPNNTFLAREFITGQWYRLDATNGKVRLSSSSFFNWDPQPEGFTVLDLSSDDECVPIDRVNTVGRGTGNWINDKCPLFLFGARHYHSYIKGSDETDNSGEQTPLAFMFAYTIGEKTIGRLNCENDDGQPLTLDDGTQPTISLLFQFKDGLFAKFWADYDEILRHGNRIVEVNTRINKLEMYILNLLNVLRFKNIKCLIDTATYSLPADRSISVDLKLRTIQTQGKYDIKKEQNIPDFSAASRHLEWSLSSETYGPDLDTYEARQAAANKYIEDNNYQPHGEIGDYWYISSAGASYTGIERQQLTWQNDPNNTPPTTAGQTKVRTYKATLFYDIFEIHDMAMGPDEDDWELDELPIGSVAVSVDYTVSLVTRWVYD